MILAYNIYLYQPVFVGVLFEYAPCKDQLIFE